MEQFLNDLGNAIESAVESAVSAVGNAFSGGGGGQDSGQRDSDRGGSSRPPRPPQRPSVVSVAPGSYSFGDVPDDNDGGNMLMATRDLQGGRIPSGTTAAPPSFGVLDPRSLISRDPGNVMRNIQGTERMGASMSTGDGGDRPEAPKGERPAAPTAPAVPAGEPKGARPGAEGSGEGAAARARRLGLAATIATSPGGLLAGEGTTRQRRSLMGGGLIR